MSGGDSFFVDPNALLYSMDSRLQKSGRRTAVARKRCGPTGPVSSVGRSCMNWQPVEMTSGQIRRGWHGIDRAQLSYWDSLIVAAAERMECAWLLGEDFQAGQRFGAVTIVNPFLVKPVEFGLE
jgi:predicted nucleic acid-binding protein